MNNDTKLEYETKQLIFKIKSILRELMYMHPDAAESAFYIGPIVTEMIKKKKSKGVIWIYDGKGYQRLHIEGKRFMTAEAFLELPQDIKEEDVIVIEPNHENKLLDMVTDFCKILSIIDNKTYMVMDIDLILKKVREAYSQSFDMKVQKYFIQSIKGFDTHKPNLLQSTSMLKDAINNLQNEYEETRLSGETYSFYLAFFSIMEIIPSSYKSLTDDLNRKLYYLYYESLAHADSGVRISAILKLLIDKIVQLELGDEVSNIVETLFLKGKNLVEKAKNENNFESFYSTLYKAGPNFYSAIIILKILEENPEFEYKRMELIQQRKNIDEFNTRTFSALREGKTFDISNTIYNLLQITRQNITSDGINMTKLFLREQIDINFFYPMFIKQVISQVLEKPELCN